MTGSVGFQSTLITSANNFVAALYDTTDVSTVLESIPIPKSGGIYPPDFQVTFLTNLLQDKVYRCILWETADTSPHGVSRISGDFKASLNSIKLREPLYLIADISAGFVSGTNTYTDSSLEGWNFWIDVAGTGPAFPGSTLDYTYDISTNTITYNLSDWYPSQRITIFFQPQVAAAPQPPVSQVSSGRIIKTSTTLTNSDKNKALIIQATGNAITVGLMALSSLADFDRVIIYSMGGNHLNVSIPCQGTDKIVRYNVVGGTVSSVLTQIVLGQNEKLEMFKFTDPATSTPYFWVDGQLPGVDQVGELVETYDKYEVNVTILDGSRPLRAVKPRLYAWANRVNAFIAEANWADLDGNGKFKNKGFFTQGDGSTDYRLADLREYAGRRAINGTSRLPGSFENQQVGVFALSATIPKGNSYTGGPNNAIFGNGAANPSSFLINLGLINLGKENLQSNTGVYLAIRS